MAGGKYCLAGFKVCFLGACRGWGGGGSWNCAIFNSLYLLLKAVGVCSITCFFHVCVGGQNVRTEAPSRWRKGVRLFNNPSAGGYKIAKVGFRFLLCHVLSGIFFLLFVWHFLGGTLQSTACAQAVLVQAVMGGAGGQKAAVSRYNSHWLWGKLQCSPRIWTGFVYFSWLVLYVFL